MEKNIFIKTDKKYNPDINDKITLKSNERNNTTFNLSTNIYNPITGVVPQTIKSNKDLILEKDKQISSTDIKTLILQKEQERLQQDSTLKPVKSKIITNSVQSDIHNEPVCQQEKDQPDRTNYIKTFQDLKYGSNNNNKNTGTKKYDNILDGLKDLGIIKY